MNKRKTILSIKRDKRIAAYFTAPALITVFAVLVVPMLFAFLLSFTSFTMLKAGSLKFIGLGNYIQLFSDRFFVEALSRTAVYVVSALGIELAAGLGIAMLISRRIRLQGLFRTLMTVPMMFAPVQAGFLFKWIFNDQTGFVNNLIYSITGRDMNIAFLVEPGLGFLSILTAEIWLCTPFMILILLAGLASLSREPFEAARVDGASFWQQFRFITLPLMDRHIYIALAIRFMDIARTYDIIRIMTDGGPANRTEMIWTYIYRLGINSNRFALGSAMSFIAVGFTYVFVAILFRQFYRSGSERL